MPIVTAFFPSARLSWCQTILCQVANIKNLGMSLLRMYCLVLEYLSTKEKSCQHQWFKCSIKRGFSLVKFCIPNFQDIISLATYQHIMVRVSTWTRGCVVYNPSRSDLILAIDARELFIAKMRSESSDARSDSRDCAQHPCYAQVHNKDPRFVSAWWYSHCNGT